MPPRIEPNQRGDGPFERDNIGRLFGFRPGALDRIAERTYPTRYLQAKKLVRRISYALEETAQRVDFGNFALDIGCNDGRYTQVIRELGPSFVTAIEPKKNELEKGIAFGCFDRDDTFAGTLQEYNAKKRFKVDSAFIFNIPDYLATDETYIDSLLDTVKPGGTVLCTAVELDTLNYFRERTINRERLLPFQHIDRENRGEDAYPSVVYFDGALNHFLVIGRVPVSVPNFENRLYNESY